MIKSRIYQGLSYLFLRYNKKNNEEVKIILNEKEYMIFDKMSDYDKLHSFRLYSLVKKDELLKDENIFLKLALLHDCGKENIGLIKRVIKVLSKNKIKENHEVKSFEKLKDVDMNLANLARLHHSKIKDDLMKRFQKLDDKA